MLKAERHVDVQAVLLFTLTLAYQGICYEVVLKYGDGDISESSLVFSFSKEKKARLTSHYFHHPRVKTFAMRMQIQIIKAKALVSCGRKMPT
jgi:hypothetical protein